MLEALFAIKASDFAKCFWPTTNCQNPAIRAHSVQNATALSFLEDQGHVIAPTIRLDTSTGPIIDLNRAGRNRATTFAGLCAVHDQSAFAPIELGQLDLENAEHRFLLAFRAVFYEVHATALAGIQMQSAYLKRTELGLDPKEDPSPSGLFATQRLIIAYETYMYMSEFSKAYFAKRFEMVQHDLRILNVEMPTLAASALFSLDNQARDGDVARVCLTVLPTSETQTAILLSYTHEDSVPARGELRKLLKLGGTDLKRELSRRLLNHCGNFVLSPRYVASWSVEKRDVIVDLFKRTVFQNDLAFDHPELNLFL